MRPKVLVVAGNRHEYDMYMRWACGESEFSPVMRSPGIPLSRVLNCHYMAQVDDALMLDPDYIIFTGTWYERAFIRQEVHTLRVNFPRAAFRNTVERIHVFAMDRNDFTAWCVDRHLNLDPDTHEAIFVAEGSPAEFRDRYPDAIVTCTENYRRYTRHPMRRHVDRADAQRYTRQYLVSNPPFVSSLPDDLVDRRRPISLEWPAWLPENDRLFLEEHFHAHDHMRRVCCEMLAYVAEGHGWEFFAQKRRQSHITCWIMYTKRVDHKTANFMGEAYSYMYELCGNGGLHA